MNFSNYNEFFDFYLTQHSRRANRLLHAVGTVSGLLIVLLAFYYRHWWYALLALPVAYGFAWAGHFFVEKNRPATFGYPLWSFLSDFRMLGRMILRRL